MIRELKYSTKMSFRLQVSVVGETVNISGQSNSLPVKVPPSRLSEDLSQLLDSSNCSDVTLAVGSKEFKVHKSILSGMSVPGIDSKELKISLSVNFHQLCLCECKHVI